MKVHLVGGGAIGLLCSYYLARAGKNISLLTRTAEQAEAIKEKGITVIHKEKEQSVSLHAMPLDEWGNQSSDCLILAVKSHQITSVLEIIRNNRINFDHILFLSNGMGHIPVIYELQTDSKAAVGVVEHGAVRKSLTSVNHTGAGRIRWSPINFSKKELDPLWENTSSIGFPVKAETDWIDMLQTKLIINVCINPLTAILKVKNGVLLENSYYKDLVRPLFNEAMRILNRNDYDEMWSLLAQVCEKTASNQSSMLTDLLKGIPTEIDSITGYLIKEARKNNVPHPYITFVHHAVKGLEV
ncbi:2-dehydropantoate 2-reductase [Alkalihalophilus marmarensis]|uniref:2-dehydropantoate 2-reductase n=1 Tax=Alkalihalophilus marmarensis DSM 21297 TaxID=1188261 RepID=U6SRG6_9BACI|nr:2-dehydropantoate 2-reductase [Alkalihalophilus marmarensis]ERN53246.1 hypothetical protein A33I_12920 [Alkalihalophilus marmarensis DSM 21297]MCM3489691.1 2-dehydropantoate 2-reductase [Alkalihalophilus marmarensis]